MSHSGKMYRLMPGILEHGTCFFYTSSWPKIDYKWFGINQYELAKNKFDVTTSLCSSEKRRVSAYVLNIGCVYTPS